MQIKLGQFESSLLGFVVWNDDSEEIDEEDSPCTFEFIVGKWEEGALV